MAFRFQWPYFSEEFMHEAKTMLTNALNKGNKPAVIVDHITVKELDMGTLPPELEMLEMGELSTERFRGIFKLTYNGDAHIVLQTKVQANPMNVKKTDNPSYTRRGILAADQPLVVPMLLRISDFKLRGIIVLVVDQIKGITLVFKNDPLESVLVSSTFDSITPIQKFLQSEIEKQLRNLFQEDLPSAIHNLSQQFTKKPEDGSRQQQPQPQQNDIHRQTARDEATLQSRSGAYDSGMNTPKAASQNPSRRSSMKLPPKKKLPGKTSSEPDLSSGTHYEDGINGNVSGVRKPASATMHPGSSGSRSRPSSRGKRDGTSGQNRDPHTGYTDNTDRDLLDESLNHPANRRHQNSDRDSDDEDTNTYTSNSNSNRNSNSNHQLFTNSATSALSSTMERLSMKQDPVQQLSSSLGIAESAHLANQFANLIHSNQTISPYAQNLEHFAFRSVPPKRPASVQYYSHHQQHQHQQQQQQYKQHSAGIIRSATNSNPDMEVSNDGLRVSRQQLRPRGLSMGKQQQQEQNQLQHQHQYLNQHHNHHLHQSGQPDGMSRHGQGSPRVSHRRMAGKVGIRRYAMQLGAGNGPRALSDYDSDEYNDMDEALSESEYVYVEKAHARPSEEVPRDSNRSSRVGGVGSSTTSLQTIDGYSTGSAMDKSGSLSSPPQTMGVSRSPVDRGQPVQQNSYARLPSVTTTMPGGFSSYLDSSSWHRRERHYDGKEEEEEEGQEIDVQYLGTKGSRSSPSTKHPGPRERLDEFGAMQQKNKHHHDNSTRLSSAGTTTGTATATTQTTTFIPNSTSSLSLSAGAHRPPSSTSSTTTTTARTFSSTQQRTNHNNQQSKKLPPPASLKRDKRNSSILSSRRVSSAGIGLGFLSKESSGGGGANGGDGNGSGGRYQSKEQNGQVVVEEEKDTDDRQFSSRAGQQGITSQSQTGWFELEGS
ncbi:ERMES complex subunit [Podila humilis]|nr:ERMES complex subunit [Podila humilis]